MAILQDAGRKLYNRNMEGGTKGMMKTISLYISYDQDKWLELQADKFNRSKSYIVQQLIDFAKAQADKEG